MIERTQPICKKSLSKKGELVWTEVAMERWQMEMFRVRYYGDFMAHWMMKKFQDLTGFEPPDDFHSMSVDHRKGFNRPLSYRHPGD